MPPARRHLKALGSLQLVGYANNPSKVITELAFITDVQVNALEGGQGDVDTPLEVHFDEFMDRVNSRGKGTKTRQRKMTVEQAAAVLLVTVQKGHVELIAKENDPHTIDVIKILPEAKRILATFLPKLRGYGDIPYDQQYRGAIALAKRHFFPKGKAPTKKELMELLLQSYQERRELSLRCQAQHQPLATPTKSLGTQTSLACINGPPNTRTASGESAPGVDPAAYVNTVETPSQTTENNDLVIDIQSTSVTSEGDPDLGNDDDHDVVSEPEAVQLVACTPVAQRSFNPYLTPESNPRNVGHSAATPSRDASPTPVVNSPIETATDEDVLMGRHAAATFQGIVKYYCSKLTTAHERMIFLERQKQEIQTEFDSTRKKLDETEKLLQDANADRGRLRMWGNALRRRLDTIYQQLGMLQKMTAPEVIENEELSESEPGLQGTLMQT